jgi:hypothetical protein
MPDFALESEHRITSSDGIQVYVCIAVPHAAMWAASGDRVDTESAVPPIAQMVAAAAMKQINEAKNEVPF